MQKKKKKLVGIFFCIFECLLTQNPTNQGSQLSWFFQDIYKAITKCKTRELLGIISARKWYQNLLHSICYQKESRFWRPGNQWKTWNSDLNFFSNVLLHSNSIWYESYLGHLVLAFSKYHEFWRQNLKKSAKKAKKLDFMIFWGEVYISWSAYPRKII